MSTSKIQIEIDLAHLGIEYDEEGEPMPGPQMQDLIVAGVVDRLVMGADRTVRDAIASALDQRIEAVIDPIIMEVATGEIQQRHSWGDAKGEPTTLREEVRKHVETFVSGPLTRDTYDRDRRPGSLKDVVASVTKDVITKEMAQAVSEAKAEVTGTTKRLIVEKVVEALGSLR